MQDLINSKYSQALHAVGTAVGPNEGIAQQKAEMQARAELATIFQAQVDNLKKSYQEAVNDKAMEEYKNTIEIFTHITISGTQTAKAMIKTLDNGSFQAKVLMVLSAESLKALVDEKMNAMTAFKATQGYKELEDRVTKEKATQGN
jgi:hypothetical protein